MKDNTDWLFDLKPNVLQFLQEMSSIQKTGYYRYSYSGDLYNENTHWNVGSSVFALKIYYTLGVEDNEDIEAAANYIKTFQHENGWIYDNLIFRKSFLRNILVSMKYRNFSNFLNKQYIQAETRQCYSALMLFNKLPGTTKVPVPTIEKDIDNYLSVLNWHQPWAAGSHFSHLMFFLMLACKTGRIERNVFDYLTEYAIKWVNRLQHPEDGCWYSGNPDWRIKVNGAMKILTGLIAIEKVCFDYPEKLIDLCLEAENDESACDNFNIILVLNYADKLLSRAYRQSDIEKFALRRLSIYNKYYHDDKKGFSFYMRKANNNYYGAKISQGLDEPDIHGTVLFLWGISIIVQLLGMKRELDFREFKT